MFTSRRTKNASSASDNNNRYSKCCCARNNSVDQDQLLDKGFVLVQQEPATNIAHVYTVRHFLSPGTYLHVKGRTNPGCTRFSVDFTCGPRSLADGTIAFHFNPRLQEGYVVRNCLLRGYWGEEETASPTPLALAPDAAFELVFYVAPGEFYARIDGRHFCSFRHRVQWQRITSVEFVGDVAVHECVARSADAYPFVFGAPADVYQVPLDASYSDDEDMNLPMPFLGKINQNLMVGCQLEVCGKVKLLPHSFYINLQHGLDLVPHPVIPLHLNPRFSASCGANAFVRNAWTDGKWYSEERAPGFPFSPGYSFTLAIRVEANCYSVWVDGRLIAEYPYRVQNKYAVNAVYIQGDIFLRHVSVQRKSRYSLHGFRDERASARL